MNLRTTRYPSRFCYIALSLIVIFDCVALLLTNASLRLVQVVFYLSALVPAAGFSLLAPRAQFTSRQIERVCIRAAHFCHGFLFLMLGWISLRLFNHLSMKLTAGIGYVDGILAEFDRLLVADWVSYFEVVQAYPALAAILDHSYTSLTSISVIAFCVISCRRDTRRAEFFLEAFFVTAVICTVLGMFFPAQGAVLSHLGADYDFSHFAKAPGLWFIEPLSTLRSGDPIVLDIWSLPGLVTFPSFHVAAIVTLAASFWRTGLFLPVAAYSLIVAAATPVYGGHYFVDLIAGTLVAGIVVTVLARNPRFDGLFVAKPAPAAATSVVAGEGPGSLAGTHHRAAAEARSGK